MRDLQNSFRTFQFTQDPNVLIPWLTHPGVVALIVLAVAGGVPVLEEALKALGVALTVQRGLTPAMGFYGGVLSGLGFAAVESLLNLGTPQESWAMLILARSGTMVVHAFCSGLVGWGWGQLAHTRRPWKLLLGYSGAVVVHSLWNASAIGVSLAGLALLPNLSSPTPLDVPQVAWALVAGLCMMLLGGLALLAFAGLGLMGYLLRRGAHV
jgi:RsiW-degrading membrane proteinase PrsW (M82 family)